MTATFADDYVSTVTKPELVPLYTTDMSTKIEDIPYITLKVIIIQVSSLPSSRG